MLSDDTIKAEIFSNYCKDFSILDAETNEGYIITFNQNSFIKWAKKIKKIEIPIDYEIDKNFSENNNILPKNKKLTGKERQELGRLRAEKETMDKTVKASIKVGQFLQQKKHQNEKIIKQKVYDLIDKIYKDIPTTRINLIWSSIPQKF